MFRLGYNTNGFNCHSLESAMEVISSLGYEGVAITLDNYILNPWNSDLNTELDLAARRLKQYSLSCVIETGARFLLNPRHKHEPTLISNDAEGRKTRLKFLKKALNIAGRLNAEALSFWSGKKQDTVADRTAWKWLISGCRELSNNAEKFKVSLAFEPEPGMFIENLSQFQKLKQQVDHELFCLTLDIGHAFLTEKIPAGKCIRKFKDDIKNIHIEDMKKQVHQHLFFGEGEIDFEDIFKALKDISYKGLLNVELSRHSHDAVNVAKRSYEYLRKLACLETPGSPADKGRNK
jgi:sugar phosphate isomerase/epimerase